MCKNSIHTTGATASAVNELCTDRGSVCVTNSESTHDEPLYCRISTQKAIYKIPYQDILFIESEQKKSVIHLLKKPSVFRFRYIVFWKCCPRKPLCRHIAPLLSI